MTESPLKIHVTLFVESFPGEVNDISGTYANDPRPVLSEKALRLIKEYRDECCFTLIERLQPKMEEQLVPV